jgi:ribosome-associated protein
MKEKPWNIEGKTNSDWILLDYVNVVGHVFYKDKRAFYDIEELWADATRKDIPN